MLHQSGAIISSTAKSQELRELMVYAIHFSGMNECSEHADSYGLDWGIPWKRFPGCYRILGAWDKRLVLITELTSAYGTSVDLCP